MKEGLWAIFAFALAWAVAQVAKVIIEILTTRGEWNFAKIAAALTRSGGMPSAHAASVSAIAMFIGLAYGFDSVNFAMMLAVAVIVAYDAVNVRRAVGEHGKALKNLVHRKFKVAEGHTFFQALVGIAIGVAVGGALFALSAAI